MNREWIEGKSLDEQLGMLVGTAEVGSPVHTQIRAAIDVDIARMQREAGDKAATNALKWAKVSAVGAAGTSKRQGSARTGFPPQRLPFESADKAA
jgi:hypothetical protein